MTTWKVIIDYDAQRSLEEQDLIDQEIDRLAQAAGTIVDGGAGSGFGRRDLDYQYESGDEAAALVAAVEQYSAGRPELDLSVRYAALEDELEG